MRILMLHPHDPRYCPWVVRMVKLAEELALRGHQPTVLFPDLEMKIKNLAELRKQKVWDLPKNGPVRFEPLLGRDRHLFRNMRALLGRRRQFDMVHIQKCYPNAVLPGLFVAYLGDLPVHYDWDDYESAILDALPEGDIYPFRRLARYFERALPAYVQTISVASEGLRQLALHGRVPEDRIFKLPVGADLAQFSPQVSGERVRKALGINPKKPAPVILYQGQLEGAHDAELLIDAAAMVLPKYPEARFVVVGGGRGLAALKERARASEGARAFTFTGYIKREMVPYYVAAADVVVACFENNAVTRCKSPLKLAEYLAAGKAIVASDVGDVGMMLGDAGLLVRPGSAEHLAEGILQLLADPERRAVCGRRARRRAENIYNWSRGADILEEAYARARSLLFRRE
ncbi:glycosyltransferase family 4 protein [bacterium]|nr:glycosyltransferase family 4 protein [bacterium]